MKLLALCVFAIIGFATAKPASDRGCFWLVGSCAYECPEGTHSYAVGCDHITPEATCEDPKPKLDTRAIICDYSGCYCDPPTVRDTISKKCIPLDQCPKKD